ncbi:CMP-N-acetylneuraminate-beta-galactosamide-alpha-2,3-sialyltransferase 1 isoform X2 [Kryptolebias marmoratus]|nr:CMP-N-acetylneuraminate-beta-galactosamide-alpha-2,3-sialyltransferase 1 isoform X2 [Kryptolebias marmoratus]
MEVSFLEVRLKSSFDPIRCEFVDLHIQIASEKNVLLYQTKPFPQIQESMPFKLKVLIFWLSSTIFGVFLLSVFTDSVHPPAQSLRASETFLSEDNLTLIHRLNCSVEPLLSPKHNLSKEAFKWWKQLQLERRSFVTYKAAVEKLFQIFPTGPDLPKPCSDTTKTCSVVGNSVNLKRSHYGPLIDSQDIVIRINAAPIKSYEVDVGTKTTYHVMYPESARDLDNSTHLVLFPFKIQDLEWLVKAFTTGFYGMSYVRVKSKIKANKDLVMVVNPAFMRYVHAVWLGNRGGYPSTGFMALILALHICNEVHVFGYGADSEGNWSHYWETLANKNLKTGLHAGQHEYAVIERLADEKAIVFYKGWAFPLTV